VIKVKVRSELVAENKKGKKIKEYKIKKYVRRKR
jgi:hypothetical protein